MHTAKLGPIGEVSRLALGGGGLGQLWGETSDTEAKATVFSALDAGITLIDTAPSYLNCEAVIAGAFGGRPPEGVRFTTKCQLGEPPRGEAATRLKLSLQDSLKVMRLERVDIFILHSNICEDDYVYARHNDRRAAFATPFSQYLEEVVPAFEGLIREGLIGAWGVTGVGAPASILKALAAPAKPAVVQAIANLLDSAGGMRQFAEPPRPREIIAAAAAAGVGVMGIRAVQAGALTAALDRPIKDSHPEAADFRRAAPFRALAADLGVDPALLAHRYALSLKGVDTLVLGVKNRDELKLCVTAEALGPLSIEVTSLIDDLNLRAQDPS